MSFAMNTFNSNFDPFSIQFPRLDQLLDMELSPHMLAEEFDQSISRQTEYGKDDSESKQREKN